MGISQTCVMGNLSMNLFSRKRGNQFSFIMQEEHTSVVFLQVINKLMSLAMMILALVVGFMYFSCNKALSTWLLVYGFMTPIILIISMIILCCALPGIFLAMEQGSNEVVIYSILSSIICTIIVGLSIIIFCIGWTIYGAVLFFPVTSDHSHVCTDGKDAKVLVITGTIIVALNIIFCFCPALPNLSSTRTSTWRSRRRDSIDLGNIEVAEKRDTGIDNDVQRLHDNALVAGLEARRRSLMFR